MTSGLLGILRNAMWLALLFRQQSDLDQLIWGLYLLNFYLDTYQLRDCSRVQFLHDLGKYWQINAVWLYYRFNLSNRDIEDLLAVREAIEATAS